MCFPVARSVLALAVKPRVPLPATVANFVVRGVLYVAKNSSRTL